MKDDRELLEEKAAEMLRRAYGADAEFREHQLAAILDLVQDNRRLLLVQSTGWGKSVVYFIATRLLRDQGRGPTIIISPLLALMRDQVRNASNLGITPVTINSSNADEWPEINNKIANNEVDLLLISPERFQNNDFRREVLPMIFRNAGLLVIDEAHCISDWGHDFRPDYRRISRLIELLPAGVPVLATTATANDRVANDVASQLGDGLAITRGSLDRPSLRLAAADIPSKTRRLAWIANHVKTLPGSGIIYALTVKDVLLVCDWLRYKGIETEPYTGSTDDQKRLEIEQALLDNRIKVVCATKALGMGFDKPDLAFVIHFQSPDSVVAYYQEVGRAGRALDDAQGILLTGAEDQNIWSYFLSTSLPTPEDAEKVIAALSTSLKGATITEITEKANLRRGRLKQLLSILEVEGAVEKVGNRYLRSLKPWRFDEQRFNSVRKRRINEQQEMLRYIALKECRMAFLRRRLDDAADPCGRCDVCTGVELDVRVDPDEIAEAQRFIAERQIRIAPRARWAGKRGYSLIPIEKRVEEGRALAHFSDEGIGPLVLKCKQQQVDLPGKVIEGLVQMIRRWSPSPAPKWITFVPTYDSSRQFVPRLAEALGQRLGLPVMPVVKKTRATSPQKLMENTAQQVNNVNGAYEVSNQPLSEPVLLVDDVIDSRWTITVIGDLLKQAGAGPVFPVSVIGPSSETESES